mmetsp:Transcript_28483/g.75194  ORF Transcript_28483/g.75194 Transcript_28483/m.75194 type:complete len:388 (-) Transcript_28483:181-1344(-)
MPEPLAEVRILNHPHAISVGLPAHSDVCTEWGGSELVEEVHFVLPSDVAGETSDEADVDGSASFFRSCSPRRRRARWAKVSAQHRHCRLARKHDDFGSDSEGYGAPRSSGSRLDFQHTQALFAGGTVALGDDGGNYKEDSEVRSDSTSVPGSYGTTSASEMEFSEEQREKSLGSPTDSLVANIGRPEYQWIPPERREPHVIYITSGGLEYHHSGGPFAVGGPTPLRGVGKARSGGHLDDIDEPGRFVNSTEAMICNRGDDPEVPEAPHETLADAVDWCSVVLLDVNKTEESTRHNLTGETQSNDSIFGDVDMHEDISDVDENEIRFEHTVDFLDLLGDCHQASQARDSHPGEGSADEASQAQDSHPEEGSADEVSFERSVHLTEVSG